MLRCSVVTCCDLTNVLAALGLQQNDFPGLAEFVRNKTRDMVCAASAKSPTDGAVLALAYDSHDATPIGDFDDGFVGATLAAAALLNILLPAGTTASHELINDTWCRLCALQDMTND